jgi:heme-degrading monooxygenase HmoA
MILRTWRARATVASAEAYARHLREEVVPELDRIPGFRGVWLLRRDHDDMAELLVITRWDGMGAILAFAGDSPEVAVVAPEARAVLSEFDAHVTHFDLVLEHEASAGPLPASSR